MIILYKYRRQSLLVIKNISVGYNYEHNFVRNKIYVMNIYSILFISTLFSHN